MRKSLHNPIHMKIKKTSFLLLELLIGLGLISAISGLLIQAPILHLKKQKQLIDAIYLQIESEKMLSKAKEMLYEQSISWKQIETSQNEKLPIFTERVFFITGSQFLVTCSIKSSGIQPGKGDSLCSKVQLEVQFSQLKRKPLFFKHYLLVIQKPYFSE